MKVWYLILKKLHEHFMMNMLDELVLLLVFCHPVNLREMDQLYLGDLDAEGFLIVKSQEMVAKSGIDEKKVVQQCS